MLFRSALSSLSRTSVLSRSLKSVITGEELHTGIVKAYDVCRGFGFIRPENNAADIFCHQSDIMGIGFRSLQVGERVEFELLIDDRGPGSRSAHRVTGPDGVKVKGQPRPPPKRYEH